MSEQGKRLLEIYKSRKNRLPQLLPLPDLMITRKLNFKKFSNALNLPDDLKPESADISDFVNGIQTKDMDFIDRNYAGPFLGAVLNKHQQPNNPIKIELDDVFLNHAFESAKTLDIAVQNLFGSNFAYLAGGAGETCIIRLQEVKSSAGNCCSWVSYGKNTNAIIMCGNVHADNFAEYAGTYEGRLILIANDISGDKFARYIVGNYGDAIISVRDKLKSPSSLEIAGMNGRFLFFAGELNGEVASGAVIPDISSKKYSKGVIIADKTNTKLIGRRASFSGGTLLKYVGESATAVAFERFPEAKEIKNLLQEPTVNNQQIWGLYNNMMERV